MKSKSFIVIAAALMSFGAVHVHAAGKQEAANVQLIKDFLRDIRAVMGSRDPAKVRAVAERYMDPDYIQHSKIYPPGREGFIKGFSAGPSGAPPGGAAPPGASAGGPPGAPPSGKSAVGLPPGPPGGKLPKDLYFFGDGEFVIWVSEGMEPGKLDFNMVRVVNGKMKEHWDSR